MPQIRPIIELGNTNRISDACHACPYPIFITQNGHVDLVVMSIETYENMIQTAAVDSAIGGAETEYAADGQLHDAKGTLATLRRLHFG